MSSMFLLIALLVAWVLMIVAGLSAKAVDDTRRGIPANERRGTSIFPVIPIFPMVLWIVALLVDVVWNPWGTRIIGMGHAIMAMVSTSFIVRDTFRLLSLGMRK